MRLQNESLVTVTFTSLEAPTETYSGVSLEITGMSIYLDGLKIADITPRNHYILKLSPGIYYSIQVTTNTSVPTLYKTYRRNWE